MKFAHTLAMLAVGLTAGCRFGGMDESPRNCLAGLSERIDQRSVVVPATAIGPLQSAQSEMSKLDAALSSYYVFISERDEMLDITFVPIEHTEVVDGQITIPRTNSGGRLAVTFRYTKDGDLIRQYFNR